MHHTAQRYKTFATQMPDTPGWSQRFRRRGRRQYMVSPPLEVGMRGKSGKLGWPSGKEDMTKYSEASNCRHFMRADEI